MAVVAVLMVAAFFIYIYRNYWLLLLSAGWYGIEAEAYVNRIERVVRHAGGADYPMQYTYVCYQGPDGLEKEARLLNPKKALIPGDRLRIRYLPDKQDRVVLAAILSSGGK